MFNLVSENLELEYIIKELKERIAYLERSNNRREDTILDLREESTTLYTALKKIREVIEYYNMGKYDYTIPQVGIIELFEILDEVE